MVDVVKPMIQCVKSAHLIIYKRLMGVSTVGLARRDCSEGWTDCLEITRQVAEMALQRINRRNGSTKRKSTSISMFYKQDLTRILHDDVLQNHMRSHNKHILSPVFNRVFICDFEIDSFCFFCKRRRVRSLKLKCDPSSVTVSSIYERIISSLTA